MGDDITNSFTISCPVTCMMFFDPITIVHDSKECSLECCKVMLETPKCNFRNTAPCRVHDMPDTIHTFSGSSTAHILFCKQLPNNLGASSFNVFDLENANSESSFDFQFVSDDWIKFCQWLFDISVTRLEFLGKEVPRINSSTLSEFLKIFFYSFANFVHVDEFTSLLSIIRQMDEPLVDSLLTKPCVSKSNIIVQCILAFQLFTDVRITYIEGRHRQVKCLSVLCNFRIPITVESLCFERNNDDSLHIYFSEKKDVNMPDKSIHCVHLCRLFYQVYIPKGNCPNNLILDFAQALSKKFSKELSLAITNECCHE